MKLNRFSLKWKLFCYIFILSCLIVFIFCVFQILLLGNFYRNIKIERSEKLINKVGDMVEGKSIDEFTNISSDLVMQLGNISTEDETAIYLLSRELVSASAIGNEETKYSYATKYRSLIGGTFSIALVDEIWQKAAFSGYKQFFVAFSNNPSDSRFEVMILNNTTLQKSSSIMCGRFVHLADNIEYLLILDSRLTPVEPAVATLKTQLFTIGIIVLLLTIGAAVLLSRYIATPIVEINNSAKLLAKGKYNVSFTGHGYLEVMELNDTLNYAVEELKKTETLQRELLANVSHDLRTPLTLITGYAEMVKDIPTENTPENIQIIIDEANRLSSLVSDILNLSRISARTEPLQIEEYNITEQIRNIVKRQNKFLEHNQFEIQFIYTCDVYIKADMRKIEQVLYNFINNAVNYSGTSKVVEVIQTISGTDITIAIKDYGVGITKEDLDCIWDRYYRVDKGHQRTSQGSGLGLSIIKGILDYHGFQYGVSSKEGFGSTFWFKIAKK